MPFGLGSCCITPTRLADGFGHAQVALFAALQRNSPLNNGSPVFERKFGVYIIQLHQNYNPYCFTSQSHFLNENPEIQPDYITILI